MSDELKEAFNEYICKHDQGILQHSDDTDIDVAERAFKEAWNVQQENIDHLNDIIYELGENLKCAEDQNHYYQLMQDYRDKNYELIKDIEEVAALILTTSYTVNEAGDRVLDANEYKWLDVAANILKKYFKRKG